MDMKISIVLVKKCNITWITIAIISLLYSIDSEASGALNDGVMFGKIYQTEYGFFDDTNINFQKDESIDNEKKIIERDSSNIFFYSANIEHTIDINLIDVNIDQALKEVARKTGLRLTYVGEISSEKKITLISNSITVSQALTHILIETELQPFVSQNGYLLITRMPAVKQETNQNPEQQTARGTLYGKVSDLETGEWLTGATVMIEGTSIGTSVDMNGDYELRRVPVGAQVVVVSLLGYRQQKHEIIIEKDEMLLLDAVLQPGYIEGEEIVLTVQALGQSLAIQRQRASNSIVNIVSESRIRDVPDATAAESVGRLPGVSINRSGGEAINVAIRGLSSQFNNITVGGDRVPSNSFGGRSVALDFLSSEMLSGIELYKSNRPDHDADAIGGTVNFSLARIPNEARFRAETKGGYSGLTNKIGHYGLSVSGSNRFYNQRLGASATLSFARNDRSSDRLGISYNVLRPRRPGELHAPLTTSNIMGRATIETRDRLGASVILDYKTPNGFINFSNYFARLETDRLIFERRLVFSNNEQRWSMDASERESFVMSNRISGEHRLPKLRNSLFEWRFSHNISSSSQPFTHDLSFVERSAFRPGFDPQGPIELMPSYLYNEFRNANAESHYIYQPSSQERDFSGQFDITTSYEVFPDLHGRFKLGGKHTSKYRHRDNTLLRFFFRGHNTQTIISDHGSDLITTSLNDISMLNFLDTDYNRESVFLDGGFGFPFGLNRGLIADLYNIHYDKYIENFEGLVDNHDVVERITAGYVMTELMIGPRLMFMPGIRYEYTYAEYEGMSVLSRSGTVGGGTAEMRSTVERYGNWFPMFQGKYDFTDWFSIRVARTKSSSRPTFGQVVPRQLLNPTGRSVNQSNSNLRPMISNNYDMFFVFYHNRLGLLTLGGFYKEIDHLIYSRTRVIMDDYEDYGLSSTERGFELTKPENNELRTTVRGAEIEWQSNFTYLPSPLNGIVLNTNFTFMDSETQFPQSFITRSTEGNVRVDTFTVGYMPDQSNFISNLSFGYDYRGFSIRVSMLYQAPQLRNMRARPEDTSYTMRIYRWDMVMRQKLINDQLSVFLNLQNITNDYDGVYRFKRHFVSNEEYYGRIFDIGVRYSF